MLYFKKIIRLYIIDMQFGTSSLSRGTSLDKDKATMESKARRKADARALREKLVFKRQWAGQMFVTKEVVKVSTRWASTSYKWGCNFSK